MLGYDTRPHADCRFYILKQNPAIAYQPQSASPIPFTSNNSRWLGVLETHHSSTWLCTSFRLMLFLQWDVTERARCSEPFLGNDDSLQIFFISLSVSMLGRRIWHSVKLLFKFHANGKFVTYVVHIEISLPRHFSRLSHILWIDRYSFTRRHKGRYSWISR